MKRLMCLGLLLCLGMGAFTTRGYSADVNVLDIAATGSTVSAKALTGGTTPTDTVDSKEWLAGTAITDSAVLNGATLATANADTTLAIGSSLGSAVSGALTTLDMGDIILTAADADQVFAYLLIGGFGTNSTGPLADFPVAGAGKNFKAQFGTISSEYADGTLKYQPLSVLTGRTAVWVGINSLTGAKAMVEGNGDTAEGNTLKLDAMILTAAGELSATAISSKARLEIGTINRFSAANTQLDFKATSAGESEGRIVFANTGTTTLGGTNNKDVITFSDGNVKSVIEAKGSLVLDDLIGTAGANGKVAIASAAGVGRFEVAKDLTINVGGAAVLADVDAKGAATIGHKTASTSTAAALTLGDTFTANGVTINGSSNSAGVLTVNVKSLKSGAMGTGTGTQGDPDYVAPAFTASTITVNGAASGVKLVGVASTTGDNDEVIEASMLRVLSTAAASTANEITDLTVAADLVVGNLDTAGNLTVTSSRLRNLTQGQGKTTIAAGTEIAGMTMVFGKKEFQKAL